MWEYQAKYESGKLVERRWSVGPIAVTLILGLAGGTIIPTSHLPSLSWKSGPVADHTLPAPIIPQNQRGHSIAQICASAFSNPRCAAAVSGAPNSKDSTPMPIRMASGDLP